MNKGIYQSMVMGLVATVIQKEICFGKANVKKDVLTILNMIEDLDTFWNSASEFDIDTFNVDDFVQDTRKKYISISKGRLMDKFFKQKFFDRCGGDGNG